ncbi:RNA methyltransferase [Rhodoblastus acidophilus]|uniref:RNA methyltransferase n=1 Tax=Candidatus Rhodoblastus alkanivorans TaxID=2954117 RepID=A0ABS9Z5C9_9HYPH|nr:RNA methyltransferase [Candidatus Rhodoblastus alkanivorans]MCI4677673.1 RNA methyltransferase [Candidatus Rhodoblastus alkanivorans]MCI4682595.1 RNA methyltransferase [Candidatus Rhodoblastus alkanivorans]MDI4639901.1 RNA methyltransferase [Rhodoblastus acidophilus]
MNARLDIEKLGARGEGVSFGPNGLIFTPFALPGETILAEVDGERGKLIEVLAPSPDRVRAPCPHFTQCGGCAVQTLAQPAYQAWKGGLVADALRNAGVSAKVAPLIPAWGAGRRRATFHSRNDQRGKAHVGYMQARSHRIFELDACPILAPELAGALPAARRVAEVLESLEKPLDLVATASLNGLDLDIRGCGKLDFALEQAVIAEAQALDLARISNHGLPLVERRAPELAIGRARVAPPPGAFLQATAAGEEILAQLVLDAVGAAKKTADLFCGIGTFALRLAEKAEVFCAESDAAALAAGLRGGRAAPGLRSLKGEARDLFSRPLLSGELEDFDAVVFDPPRAGAEAQARELAKSAVPIVVGVSCNAQTFARDAKILLDGGYKLEQVTPVDQFLFSPHVELVGVFRKEATKPARRRRLLG